jgi:AcrR family transcriptional regulator
MKQKVLKDALATEPTKADARRNQVLDAAAECFRQHGFRGTSIQRISTVAGMSPGHIYHYFDNKEAIVDGIVRRFMDERLAIADRVAETSPELGVLQAAEAQFGAAMQLRLGQDRASLALEVLAEGIRNPVIGAMLQEADAEALASVCQRLAGSPALRPMPDEELRARLFVIHTLLDGLTVRTAVAPAMDMAAIGPVMGEVVHFLLQGLAAPDPESPTSAVPPV